MNTSDTKESQAMVNPINAEKLNEWLQAGEAILIDVREPAEFSEWHIPHAVSMPLTNIDKYILSLKDEKRKIVFQCLKGTRGDMGAKKSFTILENHNEVYNLTGGIDAWEKSGLPLIKSKEQTGLPMMRQVMIAAGSLVLIGSILALLGMPIGTYLTTFVSAGLLVAGLTGFCGMAIILGKMPWNN